MAATTIKGNLTGASADPQDNDLPSVAAALRPYFAPVTALRSGNSGINGQAVIGGDDQIYTWGLSTNAHLTRIEGNNPFPSAMPLRGAKTGKWAEVWSNGVNTISRTTTGECWVGGDNTVGQCGVGNTTNTGIQYRSLAKVDVGGKFVSKVYMSMGASTTVTMVALCSDNTVYTWGAGAVGQCGQGNTTNQTSPIQISSLSNIMELSVGYAPSPHIIARTTSNAIYTWGYNAQGQCGQNSTTNILTPTLVSGKTVSAIAAQGHTDGTTTSGISQIILDTGVYQSCGYNTYGGLGDNTTVNKLVFTGTTLAATNVSKIAIGQHHNTGYIDTAKVLRLSGYNGYGGLGNGNTTNSSVFVQPSGTFQGKVAKALLISPYYSISSLLTDDGEVWVTGQNGEGAAGDGTITQRTTFARVPMPETIVDIVATGHYAQAAQISLMALGASGKVYSWGYGVGGQLGNGAILNGYTPATVLIR